MSGFQRFPIETTKRGNVRLTGKFWPKGASAVTQWDGDIDSVTRNAAGDYTVTLKAPVRFMLHRVANKKGTASQSAVGSAGHLVNLGPIVAASGTVRVFTYLSTTGAPGDLADNADNFVSIDLEVKHSTVTDGSGV